MLASMGFVKTPDELARLSERFRTPTFEDAQEVSVEFLTDASAVRRLLPPGLEPADEPLAYARVGRFRSNVFGQYLSGGIQIAARHGDMDGRYVLGLYTSAHSPLVYGREFFDEPKKDAEIGFRASSDRVEGSVRRHGTTLIRIEASLGPSEGAATASNVTFNYRFHAPWNDLAAGRAELRAACFDVEYDELRVGTGRLELHGSRDDPLHELPCRAVRRIVYFAGRMDAKVRDLAEIPCAAYLPYAFGRYDDWSVEGGER
jgi:acetoacetate decarboxylase